MNEKFRTISPIKKLITSKSISAKDIYKAELYLNASELLTWLIVTGQSSPLEPVYLITWMDGTVIKVRENSKVINKTMYIAVGLRRDGKKKVLVLW